jgi:hypothetical protein
LSILWSDKSCGREDGDSASGPACAVHCVLKWLSLAQFHAVPAGTAAGVEASLVLAAGPCGLKAFTIMDSPEQWRRDGARVTGVEH